MKRAIFPILLLAWSLLTLADAPQSVTYHNGAYRALPMGKESVIDTVKGTGYDTLTFYVPQDAANFGVFIKPDSVTGTGATDSLIVAYRSLPYITWAQSAIGSGLIPVPLKGSTGTVSRTLDWTTGATYFNYDSTRVEDFSPIAGNWIQFVVKFGTSDTVKYEFWFKQRPSIVE